MTKKKSDGQVKGTPENPFRFNDDFSTAVVLDLPEGVHEVYGIDISYDSGKTWGPDTWKSTENKAIAYIAKQDDLARSEWVEEKRREWTHNNMHNRKTIDLMQLKITATTSDKKLGEYMEAMKEHRRRLKENPPAKMPKFNKSEAEIPMLRVSRVLVTVKHELVLP